MALLVPLVGFFHGAALAQPAPQVVTPQQGTPIPQIAPRQPPNVGPGLGAAPSGAAPLAAPAETMAIRSVAVEGSSIFPQEKLLGVVGGLTGSAVPLSRVEAARTGLLDLYRDNGYTFTTVDAVLGPDGTMHFRIGEAQVTEVLLDGNIGPAGEQVLRFLDHLRDVHPLNVADLERWLLLAKDIPGVSVDAVLRPAGTAPGALTLVAQVRRQAVTGYITADNRADPNAGPEQGLAVIQFNSFTSFAERTQLSLFGSARATQIFGQADEEFYVGGSGLTVHAYAGHGYIQPSGLLGEFGYDGETTVVGMGARYPLIRRRPYSLTLESSFDTLYTDITLGDNVAGNNLHLGHDAVRVLRFGAIGAAYDQFLGDTRPAANQLTVRLSQGLSIFGATTELRAGAHPSFVKMAFEATRVQTLFNPWPTATLALQGTLAGQWSNDVLPLAEKYYLGGGELERGFYAGQVTGDNALAASAELQLTTPFSATVFDRPLRFQPTFYLFYDWGETWENQSSDPNERLQSWGGGIRLPVNDRVEVQLEGVHRLTIQPNGPASPRLHANAIFWRLVLRL
ncbi:MAG TPA: ShlB/FhaC/HecB family hemolysin secretion/activation protein [Rhodopila sp.]|uniref:ShlB/FhaC/HecB family hemolysin secretion/activation protein n=1 Tax=Rhodopila sp. TaxID=2480087 RepID=UPI002CEB90CF|nr:ShlB/FhaC/HecB family hemolysin secretion/activation protein [Rhodopila sp.]HVY16983.1 ShlB/FhaC/HecB family hemolysin secretion/activation protein [Rhodopila sp.]